MALPAKVWCQVVLGLQRTAAWLAMMADRARRRLVRRGGAEQANEARQTIEQEGAEARRIATEFAVANQQAAAAAVGGVSVAAATARAAGPGVVGTGDPEHGGRTGYGVGHGAFDVEYTRPVGEDYFTRYGRKYKESNDWSPVAAQYWEDELVLLRDEQWGLNQTLRLFKVA